jgi:hypothetical protein
MNKTKEKLKRRGAMLVTATVIAAGCSAGVEDLDAGDDESADEIGQFEEALKKPTQTGRPRPTHNDEAIIQYQKDCEDATPPQGGKKKASGKKKRAASHEVREGRKEFYSKRMPGGPMARRKA